MHHVKTTNALTMIRGAGLILCCDEGLQYPFASHQARLLAPQAICKNSSTADLEFGPPTNALVKMVGSRREVFFNATSGVCYAGTFLCERTGELTPEEYKELPRNVRLSDTVLSELNSILTLGAGERRNREARTSPNGDAQLIPSAAKEAGQVAQLIQLWGGEGPVSDSAVRRAQQGLPIFNNELQCDTHPRNRSYTGSVKETCSCRISRRRSIETIEGVEAGVKSKSCLLVVVALPVTRMNCDLSRQRVMYKTS